MAFYQYKVRDSAGKPKTGFIEADDRQLVIQRLRQQGYLITSIDEKVEGKDITEVFAKLGGVNLKDLSIFSRQFATMIIAGLPVVKALTVLEEQTPKALLREAVSEIKQDVEAGNSLSMAFQKHPKVFPEIFVTMVRAGEVGGILDIVLARIADHFEKEYELNQKIKAATRYPLVISIFALAVVGMMMVFVLPTFANMFQSMEAELPTATKVLMGISGFIKSYIILIIIMLIGAFVAFERWRNSKDGRESFDTWFRKVPVFGSLGLKISIARVCRTLGTLLASGVHILPALEIVESIAGNSLIEKGLANARQSIREGSVISTPLKETAVFPSMVIQMISVGEETGNLDQMLTKIADFYDEEVKHLTNNLSGLIEPFLIIFLGIAVGLMVYSILLPMFSMFEHIG